MNRTLALVLAACGGGGDTPPDAALVPELPCEVRDVVAAACAHCHSSPTSADAPMPLLGRADFFAASSVDGESIGARTLARLRSSNPMPPRTEPAMSEPQIAALEAWITAGMPAGDCAPLPAKPIAATCTSGSYWRDGRSGSPNMMPGMACQGCHYSEAADHLYFFMGTVYPSFHEPVLCNSTPPPDTRIEILDMQGTVTLTLTPNAVGNFMSSSEMPGVPLPYRARVIANGRAREMATPQMFGDCNACHSEQGSRLEESQPFAPGRIVWP